MDTAGRVSEFVDLFTQSTRRVYAYIRTLIPNQADAEDVFQETSRVLWEKFAEYEPGTDFCAWALSIAHYRALKARHRKNWVVPVEMEQLLEDAAVELREQADARFQALAGCLQKLPPADRELINARYRHGASTRDVATQANRSTDAIYRSLRRIHKALFDCIRKAVDEEVVS